VFDEHEVGGNRNHQQTDTERDTFEQHPNFPFRFSGRRN
jgi:hypothetical protein